MIHIFRQPGWPVGLDLWKSGLWDFWMCFVFIYKFRYLGIFVFLDLVDFRISGSGFADSFVYFLDLGVYGCLGFLYGGLAGILHVWTCSFLDISIYVFMDF